LSERQRKTFPLIAFPDWRTLVPGGVCLSEVSDLLKSAFVILGETRPENSQNHSPVNAAAATSDAIGAIEIMAAIETNNDVRAGIDEWADVEDQAVESNLLVVGSPAVNLYSYAANLVFSPSKEKRYLPGPVGFNTEQSGLLRIVVDKCTNGDVSFFPESVDHYGRKRHFGMAMISKSPFNPERFLLWVAGISGFATQAVARFIHDMIRDPKRYLRDKRNRGCPMCENPTVAIIEPFAQGSLEVKDYIKGGWRVSDYRIEWLGRY